MDSQEPTIEEKLVPFVEGALAEADRREVLQALPNSPALTQEVRQLREAILQLRTQAARGMTYQSPVEAPPEQVVDFALQGEQWSRQSSRQFQLHLLESSALAEELSILKELEQDLQQRQEPSAAIPEMPAALRAAIQETYGRPAPEAAWKKTLAALVAWLAGMNIRVAAAAAAGCVVIAAGVGVGRYAHQHMLTPSATRLVASSSSTPTAAVAQPSPAAVPAGQVALLKDKVLPEDLPGLSRRLWQKQVSHSYRDGQIYVAQADYEKAWGALQLNPEKVAVAQPLKTGAVPEDKKTNLLDGVIGMAPASAPARREPVTSPSRPPVSAPKRDRQIAAAEVPSVAPAPVAVRLPAAPENTRGSSDDANYNVAPAEPNRAPAAAQTHSAAPVRERASRPASLPTRQSYVPSQVAHEPPPRPRQELAPVESDPRPKPTPATNKLKSVFQASPKDSDKPPSTASLAEARKGSPASASSNEPVAPPLQPVRQPATHSKSHQQSIGYALSSKAPKPAPRGAVKTEEEASRPQIAALPTPLAAPASVAVEPKSASDNRRGLENKADAAGDAGVVKEGMSDEIPHATTAVLRSESPVASVPESASGGAVAQKPMANEMMDGSPSPTARPGATAGRRLSHDNLSFKKQSTDSYEVQANAPFEVAMLPVAKKLVEDTIGEAKVQMERKEDGHLLVTIRPVRSLSAQEVDKLRKIVRKKLELEDEDTVVIRQP